MLDFGLTKLDGGYIGPEILPDAVDSDALIAPSTNMIYGRSRKGFRPLETYPGYTASSANRRNPIIIEAGSTMVFVLGGNAIQYIARTLFIIGSSGAIYAPDPTSGTLTNIGTNSSILQLFTISNGHYNAGAQAGLAAPETPGLAARSELGPGMIGKNTGTYSGVMTKFRSTTGAESNPSEATPIVSASGQSMRLEFPPEPVDGTDGWRWYPSPPGLAALGPYLLFSFPGGATEYRETQISSGDGHGSISSAGFLLTRTSGDLWTADDEGKTITVAGAGVAAATLTTTISSVDVVNQIATLADAASTTVVAAVTHWASIVDGVERSVEIEWLGGELLPIVPPIDANPPEAGMFVVSIADVMAVIGTFDGMTVSVSRPGFPESYPARWAQSLPEPAVAVIGRPQDGFVYILCKNSIHQLIWTGATDGPPLVLRPIWDRHGCAGQLSACVVGTVLYWATPTGKFMRATPDGQVDLDFGAEIEADTAGWTPANIIVTYDEGRRTVLFAHAATVYPYMLGTNEMFSPKIDNATTGTLGQYPQAMTSGVNLNGRATFVSLDAAAPGAGTVGAGSPNFTKTSGAAFTSADVGKIIAITGAGTAGGILTTTILTFTDATHVVLATNAITAVTAQPFTISAYNLWQFDGGTTTISWSFTHAWRTGGYAQWLKTIYLSMLDYQGGNTNTVTLTVYKDFDTTNAVDTITFSSVNAKAITDWLTSAATNCKVYAIKISGTGIGYKFFGLWNQGTVSRIFI